MLRELTVAVALMSVICCGGCSQSTRTLFDGETLDGWVVHGGQATYTAEDGCIVGRRGPGRNTFLCTTEEFDNFELELDFRWDELCNSGIQIRSHLDPVEGLVQGYQCELDPSSRSWTCGLFYEGPRGWLDPLNDNDAARAARNLDDWNHVRIRADGPHIQTWLNGVPCVDFIDTGGDHVGFIALQVHSGRAGQVRWKNLRLQPL